LDDAKNVSNGIEEDMNGFDDWYDKA